MLTMKTTYAIKLIGSVKELADIFDISVQAVYKWGEEVPELRAFQLHNLHPDIFGETLTVVRSTRDRRDRRKKVCTTEL